MRRVIDTAGIRKEHGSALEKEQSMKQKEQYHHPTAQLAQTFYV